MKNKITCFLLYILLSSYILEIKAKTTSEKKYKEKNKKNEQKNEQKKEDNTNLEEALYSILKTNNLNWTILYLTLIRECASNQICKDNVENTITYLKDKVSNLQDLANRVLIKKETVTLSWTTVANIFAVAAAITSLIVAYRSHQAWYLEEEIKEKNIQKFNEEIRKIDKIREDKVIPIVIEDSNNCHDLEKAFLAYSYILKTSNLTIHSDIVELINRTNDAYKEKMYLAGGGTAVCVGGGIAGAIFSFGTSIIASAVVCSLALAYATKNYYDISNRAFETISMIYSQLNSRFMIVEYDKGFLEECKTRKDIELKSTEYDLWNFDHHLKEIENRIRTGDFGAWILGAGDLSTIIFLAIHGPDLIMKYLQSYAPFRRIDNLLLGLEKKIYLI